MPSVCVRRLAERTIIVHVATLVSPRGSVRQFSANEFRGTTPRFTAGDAGFRVWSIDSNQILLSVRVIVFIGSNWVMWPLTRFKDAAEMGPEEYLSLGKMPS